MNTRTTPAKPKITIRVVWHLSVAGAGLAAAGSIAGHESWHAILWPIIAAAWMIIARYLDRTGRRSAAAAENWAGRLSKLRNDLQRTKITLTTDEREPLIETTAEAIMYLAKWGGGGEETRIAGPVRWSVTYKDQPHAEGRAPKTHYPDSKDDPHIGADGACQCDCGLCVDRLNNCTCNGCSGKCDAQHPHAEAKPR